MNANPKTMLAPAKVSTQIVATLNRELVRILKTPDVQEKLMSEGGEVTPATPEEAAAFIRSEVAKRAKVLKDANIPSNRRCANAYPKRTLERSHHVRFTQISEHQ